MNEDEKKKVTKATKTKAVKEWEYMVSTYATYLSGSDMETELNNAGQMGWELVAVEKSAHRKFFFKRPK